MDEINFGQIVEYNNELWRIDGTNLNVFGSWCDITSLFSLKTITIAKDKLNKPTVNSIIDVISCHYPMQVTIVCNSREEMGTIVCIFKVLGAEEDSDLDYDELEFCVYSLCGDVRLGSRKYYYKNEIPYSMIDISHIILTQTNCLDLEKNYNPTVPITNIVSSGKVYELPSVYDKMNELFFNNTKGSVHMLVEENGYTKKKEVKNMKNTKGIENISPIAINKLLINEKEGIVTVVGEKTKYLIVYGRQKEKVVMMSKTIEGDKFDKYIGSAFALGYFHYGSKTKFNTHLQEFYGCAPQDMENCALMDMYNKYGGKAKFEKFVDDNAKYVIKEEKKPTPKKKSKSKKDKE